MFILRDVQFEKKEKGGLKKGGKGSENQGGGRKTADPKRGGKYGGGNR